MPILSKHPQSSENPLIKNSPIPISAKCPYSVSMMAMLNYTCELRSTMLHLPLIAHIKFCYKNVGHLLSLSAVMSMWVHSFFQRNEAVSKFFRDCLAGFSGQEEFRDDKCIVFLVLLIPLKWISKFCLAHYVVVSWKRNKHLVSNKHSVLNKYPPTTTSIYYSNPGSISVSGQLPTHPSLNPTLTLTCYQLTVVELGEG